jgi:hypothetical protein
MRRPPCEDAVTYMSSLQSPETQKGTTLISMANPKHTIHVGIAAVGLVIGAIMAIATGGDAFALGLATGGTTGIGYWLGASAQRRHG